MPSADGTIVKVHSKTIKGFLPGSYMQKPEESLDDFTVKAVVEKASGPPALVSLRSRGGVKTLKPLAGGAAIADPMVADVRPNRYRFTFFQSALASAGALAIMALILGSAVLIGMYDPPPGPEVSIVEEAPYDSSDASIASESEEAPIQTDEATPDVFTAQTAPLVDAGVRSRHRTARRAPVRRIEVAAYRPRRQLRRPMPAVTRFVPTTLVISAENGEVKTRIEPWLTAVYRKPLTITN